MDNNLLDFSVYYKKHHPEDITEKVLSDELEIAILHLIQRLRDHNPLQQVS